jgi:cytoskeletal protein CcmA (bactofilin family)
MGLFGRDDKATPATSSTPARPQDAGGRGDAAITVIAGQSTFNGTLSGTGDVRIEGRIEGRVEMSGHFVIAERGHVEAQVHARVITASGTVRGDLTADEKIELSPTANIEGDLTAPRILIREGATFEGKVHMRDPRSGSPPSGAKRPKNASNADGSK